MKHREVVIRSVLSLICIAMFVSCAQAQSQLKTSDIKRQDTAVETLSHYLQLRLQNADWKDYANFITWSDEPSWDCNWVVRNYDLGPSKEENQKAVVSVVYNRLGLFCYDFDFKPGTTVVTIKYELVKQQSGWKVYAPIPDYPDIDSGVLIKMLRVSAENLHESPERRAKFSATVRQIAEALERAGDLK